MSTHTKMTKNRVANTVDRRQHAAPHLVVGGLCGLACAAGLRGWMAQLALGETGSSQYSWLTVVLVLLPGLAIGLLLGWAAYARSGVLVRLRAAHPLADRSREGVDPRQRLEVPLGAALTPRGGGLMDPRRIVRHQDRSTPPASRGSLLVVGVCLTAGFGCALVAVADPALSSVWTTSSDRAVGLIRDGRTGAWQLANWMFAIGIWSTLAGLSTLSVLLARRRTPVLPWLALSLATGAAVLWTVNLAFRLTVMTSVAMAGPDVPDWYPHISRWADEGLLNAAALVGGPALVLFGVAVLAGDLVARWTGWFAAGCGVVLIGQSALTGDVVPALLYLAPLPIGVAALIRAGRRAK